jgi:hypothetical protein
VLRRPLPTSGTRRCCNDISNLLAFRLCQRKLTTASRDWICGSPEFLHTLLPGLDTAAKEQWLLGQSKELCNVVREGEQILGRLALTHWYQFQQNVDFIILKRFI